MRVAAGCCAVVISATAVARADPPPHCSGPKLVLEPPLSHRRAWSEAASGARRRVDQLTDVDACTHLEVEQTGGAVKVKASAADGRFVERDLAGPSELEPTVVALLVLPPRGANDDDLASVAPQEKPAPPAAPPTKPTAPTTKAATASAGGDQEITRTNAAATSYARRSLELALGGSARSASYLLGAGASLLVNARLDGWLLGGMAHAEQTSSSTSSPSRFSTERSASFGLVFGRRFVTTPFYLDVALEAPILSLTTSAWTAETVAGESAESGEFEPGSDDQLEAPHTVSTHKVVDPHADLRAGGLIRAVVPLGAGFGAFSQVDAEHTLGLIDQPSTENQPRVIAFSAGVSLGVFWGSH
jgi:hypothetical protein